MRIWSIHPKYLDSKGLVAIWREALLAKHVLEGKTKGYKKHPQLNRFKTSKDPVGSINQYLKHIYDESEKRNYSFDVKKIGGVCNSKLRVTSGQLDFELHHLKNKLKTRDRAKYLGLKDVKKVEAHPIFTVVPGPVENWEKV